MAEYEVTRKLTTILAADVVGYTRLMRADEEATLKTLGEYREVIDGLIARHEGRIFSTGGDSVLGLATQKWRAPTATGGVLWDEESGLRRSSSATRFAWC